MRAIVLSVLAVVLAPSMRAFANGAFPDSQSIVLAADRPNQIVLATNFGLISSNDDAQTWTWACEQAQTTNARLYQVGPPPLDRLFAVSSSGLVYSDDGGCSWSVSGGGVTGDSVNDAFPDPSNAQRVFAIFVPAAAASSPYTVYESDDGGVTFGTLRFTAAVGDVLTGVEIARSDPQTVYLTVTSGSTFAPKLVKTTDGGVSWQTTDLVPALGAHTVRIIAVDPQNPQQLLLRVTPSSGDELAVTQDSGATFTLPLTVAGGILTSFVRLPSGTLLLGGVAGTQSVVFRSTDGGMTYAQLDAPSLRGMSQRDGRLFGAADDVNDGYALGESTDEGQSWMPLLEYGQVQAISACLKAACQDDCQAKAGLQLWSSDICSADPMPAPLPGDASAAPDGQVAPDGRITPGDGPPPEANRDAGAAADGAADSGSAPPPASHEGCHCGAAAGRPGGGAGAIFVAVIAAVAATARRRRGR